MVAAIVSAAAVGGIYLGARYGDSALAERSAIDLFFLQLGLWAAHLFGPWVTAKRKGEGARSDFGLRLVPVHVPVGLVVGVATQLGLIKGLYWVIGRFVEGDASAAARRLVEPLNGATDWALFFFVVAIMAPITEEFFYRGLLLRSLQRSLGAVPALLASSVLFAAIHFQPYQFPGLLVVGLIAGWMALRTQSLTMSVAFHMGFNGAATVALALSVV